MKVVHVEELDLLQCADPRCTDPDCSSVMVVSSACHPRACLRAEYHKSDGTLRMSCGVCNQPVLAFKIANAPKEKLQ